MWVASAALIAALLLPEGQSMPPLKPSVQTAFVPFSTQLEGALNFPYLDVDCLVTTGIGNLIDPVSLALDLPWLYDASGLPATKADINTQWLIVKSRRDLAPCGGAKFRGIANIHLTDAGVAWVVQRSLADMATRLAHRFPNFGTLPADAQLGIVSMSWACGANFAYPRFSAAVVAGDFITAAQECWIGPKLVKGHLPAPDGTPIEDLVPDPKNPGVHPRNIANVLLFKNAAAVVAAADDLDVLHWPDAYVIPQDRETEPEPCAIDLTDES